MSINVCAYAVMSNHTHLVLHIDSEQAASWSNFEVLTRWHALHKGTLLTSAYLSKASRNKMTSMEIASVEDVIEIYRKRLCDISWFMRLLNEYIARKANKEEKRVGRFWEGRYYSQALLDEAALLTCMAYVDNNPIRANMSDHPKRSDFTSIKMRMNTNNHFNNSLASFEDTIGLCGMEFRLPFRYADYCKIVQDTAKVIIEQSKDIHDVLIQDKLTINGSKWLELNLHLESHFSYAIGTALSLDRYRKNCNLQRVKGRGQAKRLFNM
ncbi:transposase [Aliiglaciecola sp. LCG003]|nr:transposase [Aliiglaciecola sp. LCG003]WJG10012.1 transposase [Aliiglaciecola sp. LCG003]